MLINIILFYIAPGIICFFAISYLKPHFDTYDKIPLCCIPVHNIILLILLILVILLNIK